jgi:hypothetical protein
MFQEVYKRYVREIIFHVYKEGVDLPDRKKIKNLKSMKIKKHEIYIKFFQKA